jgi:two-component system, NarL family, sensor histidine kinase UhpB
MPSNPGSATTVRRDLLVVAVLTAAAAILCVRFEFSETLYRWTRAGERFQVDELPAVLLVLAICLVWFSMRRIGEARREIVRRRAAEVQLTSAVSENRRLAQQYLGLQESERRALARDLHDELGQYLNVIKIDAVTLRDSFARGEPTHAQATEMIASIDRVQASIAGLIRQLRPVGLDELGLAGALEYCVNSWRRRLPHSTLGLTMDEELESLDETRRLTLYRLVQEALTNVARHAHAARVDISVSVEQGAPASGRWIVASVADDGVGVESAERSAGLGLIGMRERVEALGGTLTLTHAAHAGFTLTARMPAQDLA